MAHFEKVKRFNDTNINMPIRKTAYSAGYDFEVAEDIVIPSYINSLNSIIDAMPLELKGSFSLKDTEKITKKIGARPTLVPTGIKCKLANDEYLELSLRSSCPLKYWLIMGNSIGIIDADYYGNESNDGEIHFQIINLAPFDIKLQKGDTIGQGIIKKYMTTEDDNASGLRNGGFGSTNA